MPRFERAAFLFVGGLPTAYKHACTPFREPLEGGISTESAVVAASDSPVGSDSAYPFLFLLERHGCTGVI